jgi:hypothetical protein
MMMSFHQCIADTKKTMADGKPQQASKDAHQAEEQPKSGQ